MDTEQIISIINIVLIGFLILIVVVRLIWGVVKGFKKSLLRAICTVLSVVCALVSLNFAYTLALPYVTQIIDSADLPSVVIELFNASESLYDYVYALCYGLVQPVVFIVLYTAYSIIFGIMGIVVRFVLGKKKKPGIASRLSGGLVSVVTGVLTFAVWFVPFVGYYGLAAELYDKNLKGTEYETEEVTEALASAESKLWFVNGVADATGSVFDYLITTSLDGQKINSMDEFYSLMDLAPYISAVQTVNFGDVANIDVTPIDELIDKLSDNAQLTAALSEIASAAATNWLDGEAFAEVNLKESLKEADSSYENVLDGALEKLKSCTKDNVISVMHEFTSSITTVSHIVSYIQNVNAVTDASQTSELASDLASILNEIDEGTADIILTAMSAEVLQASGLSESEAAIASVVLKNTLESVTEMDEEEIADEADAINTLMVYASGAVTPDPTEAVKTLVESEVIMTSVKTVVDASDEAEEILSTVTDEERAAIADAIENYIAENPDYDQENIDYLKKLFNIE